MAVAVTPERASAGPLGKAQLTQTAGQAMKSGTRTIMQGRREKVHIGRQTGGEYGRSDDIEHERFVDVRFHGPLLNAPLEQLCGIERDELLDRHTGFRQTDGSISDTATPTHDAELTSSQSPAPGGMGRGDREVSCGGLLLR